MTPQMIKYQIYKLQEQLEMIKNQTDNLFICPFGIPTTGIEILNLGIRLLNLCLDLPTMGNNMEMVAFSQNQIQDIGTQLQNIGLNLQNFLLNSNMFMNNLNNQGMMNTEMGTNIYRNNNGNYTNNQNMINIIFEQRDGDRFVIPFPYGTTFNNVIERVFQLKPELNNQTTQFVHNTHLLNRNDNTIIENIFKNGNTPLVLIYENGLYGG